ncbi:hypothetical protein NGC53_02530 [Aerococcus viridans]|uniref:hypothetical protein n=1 Tax=Aerococcus viridans TaxID=1377 RepID=UPI002DB6EBAA|nr:hypothetical protein [Aerococcus viridans]MEB7388695.1 hypothetical protein [Aerococcus viridans]
MNWITILSISGNIVALLSWFKVPDMLQSFIVKRIEHNYEQKIQEVNQTFQKDIKNLEFDFQSRLDVLKKHYEVLPELYRTIWNGGSSILQNEVSDLHENEEELEKIRNFIIANQFYLDKEILDKTYVCIRLFTNVVYLDKQSRDEDTQYLNDRNELIDKINSEVLDLEELIRETMKK